MRRPRYESDDDEGDDNDDLRNELGYRCCIASIAGLWNENATFRRRLRLRHKPLSYTELLPNEEIIIQNSFPGAMVDEASTLVSFQYVSLMPQQRV